MIPERVLERLRLMSQLSASEESPMPRGVDMSPRAVAARLQDMAELSELCRTLGTGRIEGAGADDRGYFRLRGLP
jgi:hypothetical protein